MTKQEQAKRKQLLLNKKHTMELLKKAGIKIGNKKGSIVMPIKRNQVITPEADE